MEGTYSRLLRRIAHFQVEHPYLTVLLVLSVTLALYGGVADVRTVASLEQMMPKQVSEIRAFNELRDNYLGQDMIAVVIETNRDSTDPKGIIDIRDKRAMEYIAHLKELIQNEQDIREAYAASDVIAYAIGAENNVEEKIRQMDDNDYNAILKNPLVKEQLRNFVNNDYTISIIIATTDVSADDPRMKLLAARINDDIESAGHPPGLDLKLTGTPIIQQKLGELIERDRRETQRISTILVFLITMFLFGTFSSALVPIIVVTLSVNWLYGIMGYAGIPISTLAGGVAAMVIGIGIDYAIHLMNKFKNERKEGKTIKQSIEAAVQETGTALTGAAVATSLAFIAFLVGSMPEMNRFGLLMAIGVSSAFILSIFGLPAFLILEEKLLHALKKRLKFGVEGEFVLYEKGEIHPDHMEEVHPHELTVEEVRSLAKRYKICKPKESRKSEKKVPKNNHAGKKAVKNMGKKGEKNE